ncbi:MAG: hypothetical protein ACTTHM_04395 [Peptoanaerobacter stomatis]|uniref:hypothetical protein n=1 Tax=Peptoanaerobacter stomatis TaxID=796937 RepID=UPI003FA0C6C7
MEKTLIIDGREIQFKSNASLSYIYKGQFGKDLLTSLMPVFSDILSGLDDIFEKLQQDEKDIKETKDDIKPSDIANILENVYSLELVDIQNIIWTMAKSANPKIPEPVLWYAEFEEFEIIDVAIQLAPMLLNSLISKKKLDNMKMMIPIGK